MKRGGTCDEVAAKLCTSIPVAWARRGERWGEGAASAGAAQVWVGTLYVYVCTDVLCPVERRHWREGEFLGPPAVPRDHCQPK